MFNKPNASCKYQSAEDMWSDEYIFYAQNYGNKTMGGNKMPLDKTIQNNIDKTWRRPHETVYWGIISLFHFLFSLLVAVFAHFRACLYLLFSYFAYDMDNN